MELEGISLARRRLSFDSEMCVICQKCVEVEPVSTENGRKRVWEAGDIRQDETFNRLTQMGRDSTFKYHVTNACYKNYTHKGELERIIAKRRKLVNEKSLQTDEIAVTSEVRQTRSSINPVSTPVYNPDVRQVNCVICGSKKHQGDYSKYKICETERAKNFFKVSRFFKGDVFTRTADLSDYKDVLAKDLFYHPACIRTFCNKYESQMKKLSASTHGEATKLSKEEAIALVINEITPQLKCGIGFTLTQISAKLNDMYDDKLFTNRNVKSCLEKNFSKDIQLATPKEANKPTMFFHSSVRIEEVVDMVRSKNTIRDCAKLLRKSLEAVQFDLEDRFCDEKDLQLAIDNMKIPEPLIIFLAELFGCSEADFDQPESLRTDNSDDAEEQQDYTSRKILKLTSLYQIMYYILHNGKRKTPLHIMNGIAVHDACRSSMLIKSLNHIGVSISYDDVMRYRCDLARFTTDNSNGNVPIPSHFDKTKFTIGAFDNFDHNENTMSGLDSTHDTVAVLFQEKSLSSGRKPKVSETSVLHGNRTFREELVCQKVIPFTSPRTPVKIPETFNIKNSLFEMNNNEYKKIAHKDLTWVISRMITEQQEVPQKQIIPSWPAFNSAISVSVVKQHTVGFLPLIPNPVTEFSTVYSALCNFKNVLSQLQQKVLPVACDEGVYNIAQKIILHRPEEFKNIFLLLGTFHMTKVLLACIGKYIKGSGVENIFIETSVFGVNVTEAVLNGTNYVRSFKGMLLLGEAMLRLQLNEFFNDNPLHNYDVNAALHGLRKCFQDNIDPTESMNGVLDLMSTLLSDYEKFVERRSSESELFRYWNNVLNMITLLRDLVRSGREGNWLLHLHTVQKLLPLFAAFDRINYLRWGSVYLENARELEEKSPEVYEKFMEGAFVVQRSTNSFTAVAADMCLEQTINRSKKSVSGVIGITRKKTTVTEWELIYHEILAISNMYRNVTNVYSENYELRSHHESSTITSNNIESKIKTIMKFITDHDNPFSAGAKELRNIITEQTVEDAVKDKLLKVFTLGYEAYQTFRKDRFIDKKANISDTIHRTNLPPIIGILTEKLTVKTKTPKKKQAMVQRTIQLARERGYPINELLKYELVENFFLFDENGFYTKTNKSTLSSELEKVLTETDDSLANFVDCYIVDFMACARKISLKDLKTFGDFCESVCLYVKNITENTAARIDFIFDSYLDESPKSFERIRRGTCGSINLHSIKNITPFPVQKDKFWSSSSNKVKLQDCFKSYLLEKSSNIWPNIQVFCSATSFPNPTTCMSIQQPNLRQSHEELQFAMLEEADLRIMPHIKHATKKGYQRVMVLSNDTDVLVLLLYHWTTFKNLGLKELWIRLGVGATTRQVPVHVIAERIAICHVLPALHCLTGSDCTSKVGTKHAAMASTPEAFLANFGIPASEVIMEQSIQLAEEYLVQVLKKGSVCKTMDELRMFLYTHGKNISIEDLPPTSASIRLHILRAYYNTRLYVTCLNDDITQIDPTEFGYKNVGDCLQPFRTTSLFPPSNELVPSCSCLKCARDSCLCFAAGISCCIYCHCRSVADIDCRNKYIY